MASFARPRPLKGRSTSISIALIAALNDLPDHRWLSVLYALDLLEQDGSDLRGLPLIERTRRLARLIGRAKRRSIRFNEHLTGDGPTVFDHV